MSRIARTLPVSPQMYRHFAVITVAITICVALFADGETRATVVDEVEKQQTRNELVEHEVNKLGVRRNALGGLKVKARGSGWGSDGGGGGGDFDGGGSAMMPNGFAVQPGQGVLLDTLSPHGIGKGALPPVLPQGMAPEDYAALEGKLPDNRKRVGAVKKLSQQEMDTIQSASRARTGKSEHASD